MTEFNSRVFSENYFLVVNVNNKYTAAEIETSPAKHGM